jgi:peptidoglycan hydrolase-like protein with peptidoglycan-binding domain
VRSRSRRGQRNVGSADRVAAAISQHPREFVSILMGTVAVLAIFINALFLQHGPHPAPIFAARSPAAHPVVLPRPRAVESAVAPASGRSQAQIIGDIQRELNRKGFYEGSADGLWGAKTDAAARDFSQAAGSRVPVEAGEALLHAIVISSVTKSSATGAPAHSDPIAALIAPSDRILAVQRALADFGYGQLKPTGVYDPPTKAAIEKFERDRRLPVTGTVSEQLIRELSAMTGRPLE